MNINEALKKVKENTDAYNHFFANRDKEMKQFGEQLNTDKESAMKQADSFVDSVNQSPPKRFFARPIGVERDWNTQGLGLDDFGFICTNPFGNAYGPSRGETYALRPDELDAEWELIPVEQILTEIKRWDHATRLFEDHERYIAEWRWA